MKVLTRKLFIKLIKIKPIIFISFMFILSGNTIAQESFLRVNDSSQDLEEKIQKQGESRTQKQEEGQTDDDTEKISVIGTRIRRIDMQTPAPVKVISEADIEKSGASNVSGVLESNVVLTPLRSSGGSIAIRQFQSGSSVFLVNGWRLPKKANFHTVTGSDVNALPLSAVERVEALTDGGSAIYGSDALISVVNIITRKNFDGVHAVISPRAVEGTGASSGRVSVSYGKQFSKGQFNTHTEFGHGKRASPRDSKYIDYDKIYKRSRNSENYRFNKGIRPFPNCQELDKNGICAQDLGRSISSGPSQHISHFSQLTYDLMRGITINTDFIGRYKKDSTYRLPMIRNSFFKKELRFKENQVHPSWVQTLSQQGYSEGPLQMNALIFKDNTHKMVDQVYNMGLNIGVKGPIGGSDWMWAVNNNFATFIEETQITNEPLISKTREGLISGRVNPFNNAIGNDIRGLLVDQEARVVSSMNIIDFSMDGTLAEMGETVFSIATGAQFAYEAYEESGSQEAIDGDAASYTVADGKGKRIRGAVFTELGTSYSNWLEAQLAGRYDQYSDFGSSTNGKLALMVKPISGLRLRSSLSTSFKAPELPHLYAGTTEDFQFLRDPVKCKEYSDRNHTDPEYQRQHDRFCNGASFVTQAGANPDLKAENGVSYNIGVGLQPVQGLDISIDYWSYQIQDRIKISPPLQEILNENSKGAIGLPDKIQIKRDAKGAIEEIVAPVINLGKVTMNGVDVFAKYTLSSAWTSSFTFNYSLRLKLEQELLGKKIDQLGTYSWPRFRYTFAWDQNLFEEDYSFQIKSRTTGSHIVANPTEKKEQIPVHSQYDFFLAWNKAPFDGKLSIGINNIFNNPPKLDLSYPYHVNPMLYDTHRTYYLKYSAWF